MSNVSRKNDYRELERKLGKEEYQRLLTKLQRTEPFLERFEVWADVVAFMRAGTSRNPVKDNVLRPIFQAHKEDDDSRWRTILMVIFWPGLEAIHSRKRRWDSDSEARWSNVIWAFLQSVCGVDVAKRPDRLAQKVMNDTTHKLHDEYREEWDRSSREIATDPQELEEASPCVEWADFDAVDTRDEQEAEVRRLRKHLEAGIISEENFQLIVDTRIYGMTIREWAVENGITVQAAKKRRKRAEAAIRRCD